MFLNAGRCSFERIWLHFKAIFRRLSGAIAVAPLPKAGATSPGAASGCQPGAAAASAKRSSGGAYKSREINAEMQPKTPKMRFRHFRNTL